MIIEKKPTRVDGGALRPEETWRTLSDPALPSS